MRKKEILQIKSKAKKGEKKFKVRKCGGGRKVASRGRSRDENVRNNCEWQFQG